MNLLLRLQHDAAHAAAQVAAQAAADAVQATPTDAPPAANPQSRIQNPGAQGNPGRSKIPDRCLRRLPAILDHMHVAELMSELLVEAMSCPEQADLRRIDALTRLSRTLLRAVGVPRRGYLLHQDRAEPPAHLPHHLRLYPVPDPELLELLAAAPDRTAGEYRNCRASPGNPSRPLCPSCPLRYEIAAETAGRR